MATCFANPLFADDGNEPIDVPFEAASVKSAWEKPAIDEASGLPMLSRRALLGGFAAASLAMSGMMLLPKERGGVLFAGFNPLGAEAAYATNVIWSGSFTFTVVGADQVGIQVFDVSGLEDLDEGEIKEKGTPVEDATVTLTSLFNDATVSAYTDENGKAILPIGDLAFSKNPPDGVFRANCTINVTTESARVKMRDFSSGRLCLEGASGIIVGTHKTDDADVYMERCTFDDWDIHYSKLTFLRSKVNQLKHTLAVRIKGTTDDVKVSMEVLDAAKKKTILKARETTAKLNSSSELVEGKFEGYFLNTGHDDCIDEDDVVIRITLTVGGKPYTTDLEMLIEDTPFDNAMLSKSMLPITTDPTTAFSFTATGDWPCFNGLGFSVLGPFSLVQVSTTILRTFVGIGSDLRMIDDNGRWAPSDCWKKDHKGNIVSRYKRLYDSKQDDLKKREEANKTVEMQEMGDPGEPGKKVPQAEGQKNKYLSNCDVNVIGRIALLFEWSGFDKDNNTFSGQGTVELGFSASGTLTLEFMAGPLPAYASATLGLTALGAFSVASEYALQRTVKELDCSKMGWSVNKSVGLLLKILFSLSVGIGYKGLASLSFEATFTFPFYFGWKQEGGEGKHDPHITIGVTILLEVVLQTMLFKLSGQIFSYEKKDWYDNWSTKASVAALTGDDAWSGIEPRFRLTQPDGTFRHSIIYDNDGNLVTGDPSDPFANAVPTTNAMMLVSRESTATKINGNSESDLSDEEAAALVEQRIAAFVPVEGAPGVFRREANDSVDTPTIVFVDKLPKAVLKDDGDVVTELVDYEGVNTFFFGDMTSDEIAAAVDSSAAGSIRPARRRPDVAAAPAALTVGSVEAQADERFEGDPLLGFALGVTREYDYAPVAGKTTQEPCGPAGVAGIALHDGIVPTVNAVIYKDIHSDPRQRVVAIGDDLYLFRVMTVQYPSSDAVGGCYCRSRVVASKFDDSTKTWGDPKVLEYNTDNRDLPRVNIYDYEFDIAVRTGARGWVQDAEACLIVTGGLRPQGDSTSFHTAACCGTVTVLAIDKDLEVLQCIVRGVPGNDTTDAKLAFRDDREHMLCSPCIVDGFAPNGASGSLAYAFLRRSASSSTGLAAGEASVTFCVGHCYMRGKSLSFPTELKESSDIALSADVFGMKGVAGNAVQGQYDALLTLVINRQNGYDICAATIPSGGDFSQLNISHCVKSSDKLPEIQPWPKHGTFLFVKERPATSGEDEPDFHLYEGTFDVGATTPAARFGENKVDASGLMGASFCVSPDGDFLFYYESNRDKPNSNPQADFVSSNVTGTGDDTVHHIMASRLVNGLFCADFPFCEVNHPIDHFEVLNMKGDASSFIATHITDADNSLADLHCISVPIVLAAEIEAFIQADPFVCAGHDATFSVDVRNHGNMIIGGFDLEMLDPNQPGTVIGPVHVGEIEPSKISPTAANMGWGPTATDTPQLTGEEQQGMLMPGKLISYSVDFKIPDNWKGDKTVVVRIVDAWTPSSGVRGVAAQADTATTSGFTEEENGMVVRSFSGSVYQYHKGSSGNVSLMDSGEGEGTIYHPAEKVGEVKPSPDNPGNPDNPDNSKKSGGNSGASPMTGDNLGFAGPLALATAGMAALAAGYSARRLRNERASEEGEEV